MTPLDKVTGAAREYAESLSCRGPRAQSNVFRPSKLGSLLGVKENFKVHEASGPRLMKPAVETSQSVFESWNAEISLGASMAADANCSGLEERLESVTVWVGLLKSGDRIPKDAFVGENATVDSLFESGAG